MYGLILKQPQFKSDPAGLHHTDISKLHPVQTVRVVFMLTFKALLVCFRGSKCLENRDTLYEYSHLSFL